MNIVFDLGQAMLAKRFFCVRGPLLSQPQEVLICFQQSTRKQRSQVWEYTQRFDIKTSDHGLSGADDSSETRNHSLALRPFSSVFLLSPL